MMTDSAMKFTQVVFGIIFSSIIGAVIFLDEPNERFNSEIPTPSTEVLQPDNTIRLPRCRVIYIGECPYAWCERGAGTYSTVASLTPMKEHCEPDNVTVSDDKTTTSN